MAPFVGERQQLLSKAMERAPPKSFLAALDALVTWIEGVESVLVAEPVVNNTVELMEEQLSHYRVSRLILGILHHQVPPPPS